MSTRSTISKVNQDGTITSIYCHWDGYYSNNGKLLLENYNDEKKIDELLSLGSLSSLEKNTCPPPEGSNHSFENRIEDVCVAYHRDRDDDLLISKFICKGEFNLKLSYREEYNYLWENGQWYCALDSQKQFVPLTLDMCKEK